jgi:quinohemoprotein ethanol dehydrogenase
MMRRHFTVSRCVRLAAVVATSFAGLLAAFEVQASGPAAVDSARLANVAEDPGNWLTHGRTYDEQRFSPLTQINDGNVSKLGLAWYHNLNTHRGVEGTPIVVDGVIYNTSAWNVTMALDARTGRQLWLYDPKVPRAWARYTCCDVVSRGLAVWKGKVIIGTLDGRLIALNAKTGKPVWTVQTFTHDMPYSITGAPRVFDGKVVVGNAGADFGVRGFVTAYDADTGKQLWRFYTVPGDPKKGFESPALEMAAKTWNGEWWKLGGGGTVWDSIVYDPELKLVYIGVGNGSPLVAEYRSPGGGDNLFLCSIVALKADTGEYVWHYQQVPGEEWDYTSTQSMILANLTLEGQPRKVIMQAPKNGFFYILDRATGELLSAREYAPNYWASHIDMKTGRPVVNPASYYEQEPTLITPAAGGSHNWNPMAYNPVTGLAYFSAHEIWIAYAKDPGFKPQPFRSNSGWGFGKSLGNQVKAQKEAASREKGWLLAWDPVRQREAWRVDYPRPGNGGVLTTAGNLVIQGTASQTFAVYSADKGEKLWEMPVQNVPIAGPVTYMVDGEQYIAVNAGWGGGMGLIEAGAGKVMHTSDARMLAFKLGGTATLPALPPPDPIPRPPMLRASEEQINKGAQLFARTCAICHGQNAVGGTKDLRHMTPETHKEFNDIVLGGKRLQKGMASFADILSKDDSDAIHAFVIARANEDWGQN